MRELIISHRSIAMKIYEVTYEVDGEVRSETVEASGPVAAEQLFKEQTTEKNPLVFCVTLA